MGKYFGTDGFRGEVNRVLTTEHAFAVGRFLGAYLRGEHRPRVAVGKDTRRSSYTLEYALAAGLTASGADAHLLHVIPTPGVSYLTKSERFDCGIMISASHNPYYDNGIKLFDRNGEKMDDRTVELLENYLNGSEKIEHATREEIGVVVDDSVARDRYMSRLLSLSSISLKGLRIGLDAANGSAHRLAREVFRALGATIFMIHNDPDGCNINRDCGSTHAADLQRLVPEKGLDVGFAFDGDADRCLAVDHTGRLVDGDAILYVMARHLKAERQLTGNTVVTTVMSNFGLYRALDALDIAHECTAVGDRFVHERMRERGYILGGEQSGHIIFGALAETGDGILTAMQISEHLARTGQTLAQLTEGYRPYPQLLTNLRVTDPAAAVQDPCLTDTVSAIGESLKDRGRVLVRASGTEPVVRVLLEADDAALCREHTKSITELLQRRGWLSC